jgi:hypothetical protein
VFGVDVPLAVLSGEGSSSVGLCSKRRCDLSGALSGVGAAIEYGEIDRLIYYEKNVEEDIDMS